MPCILTRCRVFILTGCNTAPYNRLQRVLPIYTTHATKQRTGLYSRFSGYLPHFTDTIIYVYPTGLHHLPHVGAYHSAAAPPAHTRYQRNAGTLYRPAQPLIIIMYIRGQTMQAKRGQLLPCVDRWQVLIRCPQYRPGTPAEGSASPPVQGQPGG